jgi:hypothetical protein
LRDIAFPIAGTRAGLFRSNRCTSLHDSTQSQAGIPMAAGKEIPTFYVACASAGHLLGGAEGLDGRFVPIVPRFQRAILPAILRELRLPALNAQFTPP